MTPEEMLREQRASILAGDRERARTLAEAALEAEMDLVACIEEGYGRGIREVGDRWEKGEYFLPELAQGAEAMKAAMEVLSPELKARNQERKAAGTVVIGTVEGDIHDIGKTLVATFLEANGFEVHDLGRDVPLGGFIQKAVEVSADLICLSALLTTTMTGQARLIELLRERGLKDRFAVMVGGAPVTPGYAREIGADGYGANAVSALEEALRLVGGD